MYHFRAQEGTVKKHLECSTPDSDLIGWPKRQKASLGKMGLCYMVIANPSGAHWWPSLATHSTLTQFAAATVSRKVVLPDKLLRSVCSTVWNVAGHKALRTTKSQEGTWIVGGGHNCSARLRNLLTRARQPTDWPSTKASKTTRHEEWRARTSCQNGLGSNGSILLTDWLLDTVHIILTTIALSLHLPGWQKWQLMWRCY